MAPAGGQHLGRCCCLESWKGLVLVIQHPGMQGMCWLKQPGRAGGDSFTPASLPGDSWSTVGKWSRRRVGVVGGGESGDGPPHPTLLLTQPRGVG